MIGGWLPFTLAFAAFFASHTVPARPPVRTWLASALGERGYLVVYAGVSLGVLGWLIAAAAHAPFVELWAFRPWQLWVPNAVMPVVCLLASHGVAAPNPLGFGGRGNDRFDPDAPGIIGLTRHPVLWALALWSLSHLVANGDLAHVILFATFAAFALLGMGMLDRRIRRRVGEAEWRRLAGRTSLVPGAALLAGRWRPRAGPDPLRSGIALGAWAGLLWLHEAVIGVSPLPVG